MLKKWTAVEDDLVCRFYRLMSGREMLNMLPDRTVSAVKNRAKCLGVLRTEKRKYNVDFEFFSAPNLCCSYWAGFIAADGTVRDRLNQVNIVLAAKDKNHLVSFAADCGYTGKVKDRAEFAALEICGVVDWVRDLRENYKIVPRKSLTLSPPQLDRENSLAFIVGLIDGDGTIRVDKKGRLEFSIVGTKEILEWIQKWFDDLVPSKTKHHAKPRHRSDRTVGNHWCYKVTGFRATEILNVLNLVTTPKLDRKWQNIGCSAKSKYQCGYSVDKIDGYVRLA